AAVLKKCAKGGRPQRTHSLRAGSSGYNGNDSCAGTKRLIPIFRGARASRVPDWGVLAAMIFILLFTLLRVS
ncbi:MAG: hypothetical protein QOI96_1780, partial [Verrucomicrobiota bacterium]